MAVVLRVYFRSDLSAHRVYHKRKRILKAVVDTEMTELSSEEAFCIDQNLKPSADEGAACVALAPQAVLTGPDTAVK